MADSNKENVPSMDDGGYQPSPRKDSAALLESANQNEPQDMLASSVLKPIALFEAQLGSENSEPLYEPMEQVEEVEQGQQIEQLEEDQGHQMNQEGQVDPEEQMNQGDINGAMKFTDLDQNILIKVFKFLDFPDLLNVANASKALRTAAVEVYRGEYALKLVKYNGDALLKKGLEVEVLSGSIEVNSARACLKMLRGFGSLITKLKLNFNGVGAKRSDAIAIALTEYSAQTLKELEWHFCTKNAIGEAQKPFEKLERLRMVSGCLGVTDFAHLFPALSRLELITIEVADRKCIEANIPELIHLKIGIESRRGLDFLKSNVKAALKANPQLLSFSIGSGCDANFLDFINDSLPKLVTLEIQNPRQKFFDSNEDKVCFKKVKTFSLDIAECKDSFKNIPFEFRRLKKFKLNASYRFRDEWIDFAVQNQNLVELSLLNFHWFYVLKSEKLTKIADLPKLNQLVLDWRVSSTTAIAQFMEMCKNLKKIRLSLRLRPERAALCAEVGSGWEMDIDEHFLTLHRN